jgi:pyruvate kinase
VENRAVEFLRDNDYLQGDDALLLTRGEVMGRSGSTNIMKILDVS